MNYYSKVIDILDSIDLNQSHELLLNIAKKNPAVVVRAAGDIEILSAISGLTVFERYLIDVAKDNKIQAIKALRVKTGMGLKESKKEIERLTSLVKS